MPLSDPVHLDGRTLEGGGQLLRIALAISALTGRAIRITDIRGNRSGGGGLKAQHLACVRWLAQACRAEVEGAEKGSKTLIFRPNATRCADAAGVDDGLSPTFQRVHYGSRAADDIVYESRVDIGTAGSTGLALQAVLPFILFMSFPSSPSLVRLTLHGGTNVSGSPSQEYIAQVLLPTLHAIGFPGIQMHLEKRGWSHGGSTIGHCVLDIPVRPARALEGFQRRRPDDADGTGKTDDVEVHATFIAPASSHHQLRTALELAMARHFPRSNSDEPIIPTIACEESHHNKRMYLLLVATITVRGEDPAQADASPSPSRSRKLGRDWLCDHKISSPERTAKQMAERVTRDLATEVRSEAWVDEHMRDQLVIFQALAKGKSDVFPGWDLNGEKTAGEHHDGEYSRLREPSLHARTAEWVAKQMLPGVQFDDLCGSEGVGFKWDDDRA